MAIRYLFCLASCLVLVACSSDRLDTLEGRPGGPYRLTLQFEPNAPVPGEITQLTFQLSYSNSGKPVTDLQIAHERLIHNFIVNRDFSSFAHIHHEDFQEVSSEDRARGILSFPYRFTEAGHYRIVSEFAHQNRSWIKHFDITVGDPSPDIAYDNAGLSDSVHDIDATLSYASPQVLAGRETDLQLRLSRNGEAVKDLSLFLGTELHGAVWREDGKYFGHLHSYTPKIAAILQLAHEQGDPLINRGARIQEMMVQLMCLDAELVFQGPLVPIRYVFPEPGRYHIFLQVAPRGEPHIFHFRLDVSDPKPVAHPTDSTSNRFSEISE